MGAKRNPGRLGVRCCSQGTIGAAPGPGRPNRRDDGLAAFIVQLVALSTDVPADEIATPIRNCADAVRARQIAMYLAHTACAWLLGRVAAAFRRDRSTASYACRRVEDLRDAAGFDAGLARLEVCIRPAPVEGSALVGARP